MSTEKGIKYLRDTIPGYNPDGMIASLYTGMDGSEMVYATTPNGVRFKNLQSGEETEWA